MPMSHMGNVRQNQDILGDQQYIILDFSDTYIHYTHLLRRLLVSQSINNVKQSGHSPD